MTGDRYLLHHRSEVDVDAGAHSLFSLMDDHRRLVGHMEKPSLMMAGATMRVETYELQGQAVGSHAERFLSGVFAAAVTPIAAAAIGNFTATEQGRARRLSFVSIAGIAGFLLGPMLGMCSYFPTRPCPDVFSPNL